MKATHRRALVVAGVVTTLIATTSCGTTAVTCKDTREVRSATIEGVVLFTDGAFADPNGKEYASCTEFCAELAASIQDMDRSVAECTGPTIWRPPPDENGEQPPRNAGFSCTLQFADCRTLNVWPPASP